MIAGITQFKTPTQTSTTSHFIPESLDFSVYMSYFDTEAMHEIHHEITKREDPDYESQILLVFLTYLNSPKTP